MKCLPRHNFRKCDFTKINSYLQTINWEELLSSEAVDDAVDIFYEKINECFNQFVPLSSYSSGQKSFPNWYSRALIKIIREKNKIHKRWWKKTKNPRDYDEFSLLRSRQKRVQSKCFSDFSRNAEEYIKHSPKYFWTYVKTKRGFSCYPKSFTFNNDIYKEGTEICSAFNTYFESVFKKI